MKGVAHESRLPRHTGEARHLPIGSDAPSWDPADDVVNTAMQASGRRRAGGHHEIDWLSGIMRSEIPDASSRSHPVVRTIRSIAVSHPGQRRTTPIP